MAEANRKRRLAGWVPADDFCGSHPQFSAHTLRRHHREREVNGLAERNALREIDGVLHLHPRRYLQWLEACARAEAEVAAP